MHPGGSLGRNKLILAFLLFFFCCEFLTRGGPDGNGSLMVLGFYVGMKVMAWGFFFLSECQLLQAMLLNSVPSHPRTRG